MVDGTNCGVLDGRLREVIDITCWRIHNMNKVEVMLSIAGGGSANLWSEYS